MTRTVDEIILEIERTLNDLSKKPLLLRCDWDQGNINALLELLNWIKSEDKKELGYEEY